MIFAKEARIKGLLIPDEHTNLYRCALAFRFICLFSVACAVGVLMASLLKQNLDVQAQISAYFLSFAPISLSHFFKNLLYTSVFDVILLAIASASALTFFCPAVLHFIGGIGGCVYGFCIGAIIFPNQTKNVFALCYIVFVFAFALLYSKAAAELSYINRSCLKCLSLASNKEKLYISKEIKHFFKTVIRIVMFYFIFRFLYCLFLILINIKIN